MTIKVEKNAELAEYEHSSIDSVENRLSESVIMVQNSHCVTVHTFFTYLVWL